MPILLDAGGKKTKQPITVTRFEKRTWFLRVSGVKDYIGTANAYCVPASSVFTLERESKIRTLGKLENEILEHLLDTRETRNTKDG